jgi:SAM-dependent methyltransferase
MVTVKEHYQNLLAQHYTWMFGLSFEDKVKEQKELLSVVLQGLQKNPGKSLAIDLGSGPGFQTIALAELGFSPVIAIDTSRELLQELQSYTNGLTVEAREADLRELPAIVGSGEASVIVCMGDTLTHLPGKTDVSALFKEVFIALHSEGMFVITYRDLTMELKGSDRIIAVYSDDKTIMTCFLEYESPEAVVVHDLVHTRQDKGWLLHKSTYRKLRLGVEWVAQELSAAGFMIESRSAAGRLLQLVAKKR